MRGAVASIRSRRALAAALASVMVLGVVYTQRSPDPFRADPAAAAAVRSAIAGAGSDAAERLHQLRDALDGALAEGRRGAALTVAGQEDPGPHLSAAAERLGGGETEVAAAAAALARFAGLLAILRPGSTAPRLAIDPGELTSMSGQIASTADPATAFRDMRLATQATLTELGAALAALDASSTTAALVALDRADAQLAAVRGWKGSLSTLPIWLDTTGKLLAAARRIATATADGDRAALEAAGRAYRAAAADAREADLALAIAVAEGGSAVSAGALGGIADALAATDDALAALETAIDQAR